MSERLSIFPSSDEMGRPTVEPLTSSVVAVRSAAEDYRPELAPHGEDLLHFRVKSGMLASTEFAFGSHSGRLLKVQILVDDGTVLAEDLDVPLRRGSGVPRASPSQWPESGKMLWRADSRITLTETGVLLTFGDSAQHAPRYEEGDRNIALLVDDERNLVGVHFVGLARSELRLIREVMSC